MQILKMLLTRQDRVEVAYKQMGARGGTETQVSAPHRAMIASSHGTGTCARKMLTTAVTAVVTVVAAVSFAGTSHAQTATPTPGMTIEVYSGARQTLKMVGASATGTVSNDTGNIVREQMIKLTYGDLKFKVARVYVYGGQHLDFSRPPQLQRIPTPQEMADKMYNGYGKPGGFLESARKQGLTTLLMSPTFQLPDKIGPTPTPGPTPTATPKSAPTATPTPAGTIGPVEASMDPYTTRLAECIRILRFDTIPGSNPPTRYNMQINVTGLANEPGSLSKGSAKWYGAKSWTPYDMALGVQLLRKHLDERGLQDVDIIAPETASSDSAAVNMVAAIKNGISVSGSSPTRSTPPDWDKIKGIATHSYGIAASDSVGTFVQDGSGASTKDWWITEAGKVNKYGDDDVGSYEAPTSTSPQGTNPNDTTAKDGASLFAARFLNDMNHMVTHWMWFQPYGNKPGADQDLMDATYDSSSHTNGVLIRSKYWYFKQLREAFPDGTVFRRSNSSLDGGMTYGYNRRAHVSVAAGKAADGTWRVGVLNLTPVETDPSYSSKPVNYAAMTYPVLLNIDELSGSGTMQFTVTRSQPDADSAATVTQTVTAVNGQITLSVAPQELITLSSKVSSPPVNGTITPNAAVNLPGEARQFTATYSDADGVDDLNLVALRVSGTAGTSNTSTNSLLCLYNPKTDTLSIYNDAAKALIGSVQPGTDTPLSNSQGTLNCKDVTVSKSGDVLTVNWNVSASGAFAGTKQNTFLFARDVAGLTDGYDKAGTWTINGNGRPTNVSVSPVNVSDAPDVERIFTTTFSDPNGYKNLLYVTLRLGGSGTTGASVHNTGAMVCVYNVQNGKVYLFNDAGAYVPQAAFPGTSVVLSNSQGSLNAARTTAVGEGNTLTVKWSVKATAAFIGTRSIALICRDRGNLSDGYDTFGTWTITSTAKGAAASGGVSRASASGQSIAMVFARVAPKSGYALSVNGLPVDVTSVSAKGSKVSLQIAVPLQAGDQIVVTWPGGSTMLAAD